MGSDEIAALVRERELAGEAWYNACAEMALTIEQEEGEDKSGHGMSLFATGRGVGDPAVRLRVIAERADVYERVLEANIALEAFKWAAHERQAFALERLADAAER